MTTPTLTLSAFLLARIAEDEEVARAAQDDSSEGGNRWWVDGPARESGKHWVYATGEKFTSSKIADHIARHDPARVLVDCKAKRRLIELHESWPVLVETPPKFEQSGSDLGTMTMRMTKQIQWQTEREYLARFGSEPPTAPMLVALAQPYADHADFRDEWRA